MKKSSNKPLIAVFIIGLVLLLYPGVSNLYNSYLHRSAIHDYEDKINKIDDTEKKKMIADAKAYNARLLLKKYRFDLSKDELKEYNNLLDVTGTGVMAHIDIPSIDVSLPIYHGMSKGVLQEGVGHLEGTSLPVGGESTHCVLSAHRGLPSSILFTDLDKMAEGDVFFIHIFDETLVYQVDQLRVVLPNETQDLEIFAGKDYCTLITCTPYSVNSHRLLVRGKRTTNYVIGGVLDVNADALQIRPETVAPFIGIFILVTILVVNIVKKKIRKKQYMQLYG